MIFLTITTFLRTEKYPYYSKEEIFSYYSIVRRDVTTKNKYYGNILKVREYIKQNNNSV
jgi:hypothetical protein